MSDDTYGRLPNEIVTLQQTHSDMTYFFCPSCTSVAAIKGTVWKCSGLKSGPSHEWTRMNLVDRPADYQLVDQALLALKRG
jgi:hypothetical protein